MRKTIAASAAALLAFTLAGCGDNSDSPESSRDKEENLVPKCADVWVAGETMPKDYEGCMSGDTLEAAASFDCKDGSSLFQYEDDFWAFGGQEIHEEAGGVASAAPYKEAYATCQG